MFYSTTNFYFIFWLGFVIVHFFSLAAAAASALYLSYRPCVLNLFFLHFLMYLANSFAVGTNPQNLHTNDEKERKNSQQFSLYIGKCTHTVVWRSVYTVTK